MQKKDHLLCLICGVVLYIPFTLIGYLPHIPTEYFNETIIFSLIVGAIMHISCAIYKSRTIRNVLYRTVFLYIYFLTFFVINGHVGTAIFISQRIGIMETAASGRASGVGQVLYLIILFLLSTTISVLAFVCKKMKQRNK